MSKAEGWPVALDGLRRRGAGRGTLQWGPSPLDPQAPGVGRGLKAEGAGGGDLCPDLGLPLDGGKVATQCLLPCLLWT